MYREIAFLLRRLMTFISISATALRSSRNSHQRVAQSARCWCNSRRQLVDRLALRVVKVVHPLPAQSPAQGGTDVSVRQPKFDVICVVGHRVLGEFQFAFNQQRTEGNSL